MKIIPTEFEDLLIVELDSFYDERGFFTEKYHQDKFAALGLNAAFVQDNFSRSKSNVIRGLHYQFDEPQAKLVGCVNGKIIDVVVDVRANSKTFGQYYAIELSDTNNRLLWVPAGFAHGFCVPNDVLSADVFYKVTSLYNAKGEGGIAFNDAEIAIDWKKLGVEKALVSAKDEMLQSFANYKTNPKF